MPLKRLSFVAVTVATTILLIAPSPAPLNNVGAPIGSTVSATAWERGDFDDSFVYTSFTNPGVSYVPELPGGASYEEYVYRVYSDGVAADVQSTSGYDGLTEAQQYAWYDQAGYTDYEFTWIGFFCYPDTVIDPTVSTQASGGISLESMKYVSADSLFQNTTRYYSDDSVPSAADDVNYVDDLYIPWLTNSLFGSMNEPYDQYLRSTVGYPSDNGYLDLIFSSSYPDFSCPTGSTLLYGRVMNPADTTTPAIKREFVIPDTLTLELPGPSITAFNSNIVKVKSTGVYLGVSGRTIYLDFNAALWGMTKITPELADTGAGDSVPALLAIGGVALVGGTTLVIVRRRRRND